MALNTKPNGYKYVMLPKPGGKYHCLYIHRAVCLAFLGPPPIADMHAAHENGDKNDNRLENLGWKTRSANEADKVRHGRSNQGARHGSAKLQADDVLKIRELYATGKYTQRQLGQMFGLSQPHVGEIIRRVVWSHI